MGRRLIPTENAEARMNRWNAFKQRVISSVKNFYKEITPKVNTPINYEIADNRAHIWRVAVWCGSPGHHQYCLTVRYGGTVWLVLPRWASYQNLLFYGKRMYYRLEMPIRYYWLPNQIANLRMLRNRLFAKVSSFLRPGANQHQP